ncbi:AAA family ATPase [Gemella sp.]
MAYYKVGPDNSTFFSKRTTWELLDAIDVAVDGDIIEVANSYYYESDNSIRIDKSISIIGEIVEQENNQKLPIIHTGIIISNGAHVTIKNLILRRDREKVNVVYMKENSTFIGENLLIANTVEEGELYPVIYCECSNLELNDVHLSESNLDNNRLYAKDSKVYIYDSILEARVKIDNGDFLVFNTDFENIPQNSSAIYTTGSEVKIDSCEFSNTLNFEKSNLHITNTTIKTEDTNAINIKNKSTVKIENSLFSNKSENYPCCYIEESDLTTDSSTFIQPNNTATLYCKNANINISKIHTSSIHSSSSNIVINDYSTIEEGIYLYNNTKISGSEIYILGKENGKVNFFADNKSNINISIINFGMPSSPTVKIERNVDFNVNTLNFLQFNEETQNFYLNDNNQYIILDKEVDISYFGEKTAFEKLEEMIGLERVKSEVKEFIAMAQMNKMRSDKGLPTSSLTLHSLFLGNPGTGKTTVARLIGKLLYEKGLITSDTFIETSRVNLVGRYVGETAIKTREVLESALGGVLFIDEAYTLSTGGEKDFGIEAINEILKFMEDHRQNIVIIFAGYTSDMMNFLKSNEGLRSRIPNDFNFEDYTIDQLIQIGLNDLKSQSYKIDEELYKDYVIHNYNLSNDNSNGRWIRNQNERLTKKLALRILFENNTDINTITLEDIEQAKEQKGD